MSEQTVRTARRKLPGRLLVGAGSALALGSFWVAIANGPPPAEATPSLAIAPAPGFAPAPLVQRDSRAFSDDFGSRRFEDRRRLLGNTAPAPGPQVPAAPATQPARPRLRTRGS